MMRRRASLPVIALVSAGACALSHQAHAQEPGTPGVAP